jgi:hypothetical protein
MNNNIMNPMGINPLPMNNMGMMMNNQPNLMDQTAMNIKQIIQPYENKIRELEEIIKQKDFEIIVLKQKINKDNSNNNFMGMNPMANMMNMNMGMGMGMEQNNNINMNMFPNLQREQISITLKFNTTTISTIDCFKDEKASTLRDKLKLTYDYKPLNLNKSFEENGISNGAVINLTDKVYNVYFDTNHFTLALDRNCPIRELIKLYFKFMKREELYQQLVNHGISMRFLFNASPLNIKDERPIKIIFKNNYIPKIIVMDSGNIPGGNYP